MKRQWAIGERRGFHIVLILCMRRHLFETEDGSHSIIIPELSVTYHSRHGAIQESQHVFIESGLKPLLNHNKNNKISIFEVGFGTGLNALLTLMATEMLPVKIYYEAAETDPVEPAIASSLNYTTALRRPDLFPQFLMLHESLWNSPQTISDNFNLYKRKEDIRDISLTGIFDLVYFDAFDPVVQPELWTTDIFKKLFKVMHAGSVLVTYSSKGAVRRAMQEAGFSVEKIPGPKGKKEIVRATVPRS